MTRGGTWYVLAAVLVAVSCARVGDPPPASAADVSWSAHDVITSDVSAPVAVAVGPSGTVYVAEAGRNHVLVFDALHAHLATLTGLAKPISLALDPGGRLYVGNAGRGSVEIYGPDLTLAGRLGAGDGEFGQPSGIAVDGGGTAYVTDSRENLVKVYGTDGARQRVIGEAGSGASFQFPAGIALDPAVGELIVTDLGDAWAVGGYGGARVQVFGTDGTLRRSFGHFGRGEGLLVKPLGVAVDGGGRAYVSDAFQNVVQVYDQTGSFLGTLHDAARPLRTPLGVAFGAAGGTLHVCSLTAARVDVFTVGHSTRSVTLTVSLEGAGEGSVLSAPAGIACPGACSAAFPAGTAVTLVATPASGSEFSGWGGACVGAGQCLPNLVAQEVAVSAHFAPAEPPPPPPEPPRRAPSDFNGDGLSDLFLVDRLGRQAVVWLLDRELRAHVFPVASARRQSPGGVADAGGDGKADVVWLSESRNVTLWTMDGALIGAADVLGTAGGAAWEIAGFADFDGDGRADLLWRNARTRALRLWILGGRTVLARRPVALLPGALWAIAGVADYDGDGRADLLWRQVRTGSLRLWLMDGAAVRRVAPAGCAVRAGWRVAGSADFNGDRRADLLLRSAADGRFVCRPGGEGGFGAPLALGNAPGRGWVYLRSGDYDGDGRDDLLVRSETTGKVKACLASGEADLRCVVLGSTQALIEQGGEER